MPLSAQEQLDLAIRSLTTGDIDLTSKLLTDPASVTIDEQRTVAQRLGIKNGFLAAAVNSASDPTVWLAFFMSRRFPTLSWLKGTIPTRFVGAANEFTGISQYTRPVETYFRGTPIPRLSALAMQRKAEVLKVGEKLYNVMDRPNWKEEMPIVSMLLEGQNHAKATPELRQVADTMRGHLEELWGFLKQTRQVRGGFNGEEITRASSNEWAPHMAPRYLRDYLPHIPLLGDDGVVQVSAKKALDRLGLGKTGEILRLAGENPGGVWSIDQQGRLTSDFTRYQAFLNSVQGQVWNQHLFQRQRMDIPLASRLGQELFVTDLNQIIGKYVSSVANTYAVNAPLKPFERTLAASRVQGPDGRDQLMVPTDEPIAVQVLNYGLDAAGARFVRRHVAGTNHVVETLDPTSANPLMLTGLRHLERALTGRADEGQIMWGNLFSAVGRHFDETVGRISNKQRAEVDYAMRAVARNRSWRNASNGITSYFHTATLGGNAWSAMQNLLQPLLTTGPAIGMGPTLAGMGELRRRIPRYASELRAQHDLLRNKNYGALERVNKAAERAFSKVFPDLAEAGIQPDVRLFDLDPADLANTTKGKLFKSYDSFAKFLLQPFNHAELANQATTFFGAKRAIGDAAKMGLYEIPAGLDGKPLSGLDLDRFINFEAGTIVNATQFRPGPGTRSIWQGSVPSFVRQFTTFPTRALSFMVESTVRGAMSEQELATAGPLSRITGGRNLGTLARMFLYGRLATIGARDALGVDLSDALGITAPFNVAPPGRLLAPLPVPPAAGVAYGVLSATATRDVKEMQPITIPGYGDIPLPKLLVPGGVALQRVLRAVDQWRPDLGGWADENDRLLARGNTSDLVLSMLGVPLDKNRRVRRAIDRTHDIRTRVRDMRRQYAMAVMDGDLGAQQQLQAQWADSFKGWPPLSVSERDMQRYRSAARLPTIQRMMQTMGDAGRFLQDELYEVDPDLLAPQLPQGFDLSGLGAA